MIGKYVYLINWLLDGTLTGINISDQSGSNGNEGVLCRTGSLTYDAF